MTYQQNYLSVAINSAKKIDIHVSYSELSGASGHYNAYRWRGARELPNHVAEIMTTVQTAGKRARDQPARDHLPAAAVRSTRSGRER